jgi:hypothetical protein
MLGLNSFRSSVTAIESKNVMIDGLATGRAIQDSLLSAIMNLLCHGRDGNASSMCNIVLIQGFSIEIHKQMTVSKNL